MATDWTVRAITRAMLPVLLLLTLVEIGSGLVLGSFESTLLRYPSLLVLVPVTIGTAGNLGSILAARLSTAFHLGTLSFAPDDETLAGNALATVALAASIFPLVGLGAWALSALTGSTALSPWTVLAVSLSSGLSLAVLAVLVTVVATYAAYRLELDPDDVVIPVVTNTCDVLGVVLLYLAVLVFV
ncbi:magnesium transporter [Haloplanus aerogenes]|uniref:ABC transporter permease n=1 Tax=Haloplanus aerogenes TaxID=660522 RepID=A0A3M0CYJ3_9EURY|nr:magnesium transporter [Haloplanus aerogenes]AZH27037.1 ABC transporter permease [Haloplanus aerogenes]RMB13470.1 mgtE-like transporter [Haloplanus aerogenes]